MRPSRTFRSAFWASVILPLWALGGVGAWLFSITLFLDAPGATYPAVFLALAMCPVVMLAGGLLDVAYG